MNSARTIVGTLAMVFAAQAQADIVFPPISYVSQTRYVTAVAGTEVPFPSVTVSASDFGPFDAVAQSPDPYRSAWAEQHSYLNAHTIEASCVASTVDLDGPSDVVFRGAIAYLRVVFDLSEPTSNGAFFGNGGMELGGGFELRGPDGLAWGGSFSMGEFHYTGLTFPAGRYELTMDYETFPFHSSNPVRMAGTAVVVVPGAPTLVPIACGGLLGTLRRRRPATA